ncbi:MAG TPA: ribosome maturation factor RimP [Coriobacteriia bacterium]
MGNNPASRLTGLLDRVASEHGYELVLVEVQGGHGSPLVCVYLDHEGGITIDQIAEASHWIKELLDGLKEYEAGYLLEVSSPGIDRPLVKLADFVRFAGSEAKISTSHEIDEQKHFTGTIRAVEDDVIVLDTADAEVRIPYGDVKKARLQARIDFGKKGTADDGL